MADEPEEEGGGEGEQACECPKGAPLWMVTFGDMMSLLLCFFVMLLSMSTMDITKFSMMMKSLKVGFGQMSSVAIVQPNIPQFGDKSQVRSQTSEQSIYLAMRVEEIIDEADISSAIELTREEEGILLKVRGNVLFEPGSATIVPGSIRFLEGLSGLLREFPHHVLVRGHTDDSPVPAGSVYPTNWELSAARSAAVVRTLIAQGDLAPTRFGALGLADTHPIVRNDSEASRRLNRRVELLLVDQSSRRARDGVSFF